MSPRRRSPTRIAGTATAAALARARLRVLPAALVGVLFAALGCPPPASEERCDFDSDCNNGKRCVLGACADKAPVDAGDADGGDTGPDGGDDLDGGDLDGGSDLDGGDRDGGDDVDGGGAGADAGAGCGEGTHDGGDGVCVAVGTCSGNFLLAYVDGDGDGFGVGEQVCVHVPLPGGFATVDGDCDDGDAAAHVVVNGFIDGDGDGFTSGPGAACTDGNFPAGLVEREQLAPVLLHSPATPTSLGTGTAWSTLADGDDCCGADTDVTISTSEPTDALTFSGFTCSATPRRVDVIRVHVRGRLQPGLLNGVNSAALPLDVTLTSGGLSGTTLTSTQAWTRSFVDLYVAGTPGDFGLVLAPGDVCAADFTVSVTVRSDGDYGSPSGFSGDKVGVDFVTVEVEGTDDCDDGDADVFAPLSFSLDADGDSHGEAVPSQSCAGASTLLTPEDQVLHGDDCDDGDDKVHPGSGFFTTARPNGSFDYNCDDAETPRSVSDVQTCVDDVDGATCDSTSVSRTGTCGSQVDADTCTSATPCSVEPHTARIACR